MSMDAFLVQQTLDGDNEAFGQLVQKYQSSVYKICLAIVKNPQDAEELTQDVFVCAYQKLAQLEEFEKFHQWIRKIAQNLSKSRRRRLKAVHEVTLTQIQDEPASKPSLEDLMLRQELIDAVMAAIESLPQKDRQVIKAYIDGFDHKTISIQTGLSYRASINRLYRIRKEITQKVKHLLNGVGVLFKTLPLKKCLEGGILAMKIKASVKLSAIAIGTMAIILAGSVSIKSLLEPNEKGIADSHKSTTQVQPQTTKNTSPPVATRKPASVSTQVSAGTDDVSRRQMRRVETAKAMDVPDSETALKRKIADEESQRGSTGSDTEPKETLLERYLRITKSPEYLAEAVKEIAPFDAKWQQVKEELKALGEEEKWLKDALAAASEENRQEIQEALKEVQSDIKKARIREHQITILLDDTVDKVKLRYFTPEEIHEAIMQMGAAGMIPRLPPSALPSKEALDETSEAIRRLKAEGFVPSLPPPPKWILDKYLNK